MYTHFVVLFCVRVFVCVWIQKRKKNGPSVEWPRVAEAWRIRWVAEQTISINTDPIHPRRHKHLQNRYATLLKQQKGQKQPEQQQASSLAPTVAPASTVPRNVTAHVDLVLPATTSISNISPASMISVIDGGYNVSIDHVNSASSGSTPARSKRKYETWSMAASTEFTRLYNLHYVQHQSVWNYDQFNMVWNQELYGPVDGDRWRTRNQTEKRRRGE